MFADPLSITYNAVSKALVRVNQDSNGSDYYFDGGLDKFSINIRHTIPAKGQSGESHMMRLDNDTYGADGTYIRRGSVWLVAKTFDKVQDTTTLAYTAKALTALLTNANVDKLLAREV